MKDCLAEVDPPTACSSEPLFAVVGDACETYTSAAGANVNVLPVAAGAAGVAVVRAATDARAIVDALDRAPV
jgi:hypothetical protein